MLKKINENSYACCSFTITLADEIVQRIFEPRASTTAERFAAIRKLRKQGIHSGVYFYPVLPFIGDTDENMQAIYDQAQKVNAEFVYCWGLTLKPGRSKQEFLETVNTHFPALLPKYKRLYSNNNKYGHPDSNQFKGIHPEVKGYKLGYEHKLPYAARRYIPQRRIKTNLQVSELLIKIAYIKSYILQDSSGVRKLYQTSALLETYPKDISRNTEELKKLPIAQEIHPYIQEFIKEHKSEYLETLEKQAYHSIIESRK